MHLRTPLLSNYQNNEEERLQVWDKKLEQSNQVISVNQKDSELTIPLLSSYAGKEIEEAVLSNMKTKNIKLKGTALDIATRRGNFECIATLKRAEEGEYKINQQSKKWF